MKLCKIGIHDWEVIPANEIVDKIIEDYMKAQGFRHYIGGYVQYWWKDISYGKVEISDWSWDDVSDIDSCKPYHSKIKVCLNCNKVLKTFNEDQIRKNLDYAIAEETRKLKRKFDAEQIIKN